MSSTTLLEVLQLPTAPLHETVVVQYVRGFAGTHDLDCTTDRFGNLYLTNQPGKTPRCVVAAHLDHPGIVVRAARGKTATIEVLGGLRAELVPTARWRIYTTDGTAVSATTTRHIKNKLYTVHCATAVQAGDWGCLALPPAYIRNGRVSAPAIDNLAGVAAVLDWLAAHRTSRVPVLGVLTRAEEIGFAGAAAVVRAKRVPKDVPWIVLEASNAKVARVAMGGGPVVRVGDRMATFHPHMDLWLQAAAQSVVADNGNFLWQRALMTGGRMEASLYNMENYCVGSLVLPLANYHNTGARGFVHEYIALNDWIGLRRILDACVALPAVAQVVRTRHRALQREIATNLQQAMQG